MFHKERHDQIVEYVQERGRASVAELAERFAHDGFRFAASVDFGIVEKVDPRVVGCLQALGGNIHSELAPEGHPRSKRKHTKMHAGLA